MDSDHRARPERILAEIGGADLSASARASRLPVSRQAIAKHLRVLADAGLVESVRAGRENRYRAVGTRLRVLAAELEAIGRRWDRRPAAHRNVGPDDGSAVPDRTRPGIAEGPVGKSRPGLEEG